MREVDFVVTDYGTHGFGISSPQLPGLVAGVETTDGLTSELMALGREACGDDFEGFVIHLAKVLAFDSGLITVQCRQEYGTDALRVLASRLEAQLDADPGFRRGWLTDSLGDALLVVARDEEPVARVARAVPVDQPFTIVVGDDLEGAAVGVLPEARTLRTPVGEIAWGDAAGSVPAGTRRLVLAR